MRYAFLFPGMASQREGMGRDLAERWPEARAVFSQASAVLGYDFAQKCFYSPLNELTSTQEMRLLTMFVVSVASLRVLEGAGLRPAIVAGASGGIFASLLAADAIDFAQAVRVLEQRGRLIASIPPEKRGSMLAIITANEEVMQQVELIGGEEKAHVGLYNSPTQIVFAGSDEVLRRVRERVRGLRGVYIPRPERFSVGNAHHSPLLMVIQEQWCELVNTMTIRQSRIPVLLSGFNEVTTDPHRVREALLDLNGGAVYWRQSFSRMLEEGYRLFLEVGPCQTLTKLASAWKTPHTALPCGTVAEIEAVFTHLSEKQAA